MSCSNGCLPISVPCCQSPVIDLGLSPNAPFSVQINKPGSNRFYIDFGNTDENGKIEILKTKFPDGYFATGYLKGELLNTDKEPIPFVVDAVEYNCFMLELVDKIEF